MATKSAGVYRIPLYQFCAWHTSLVASDDEAADRDISQRSHAAVVALLHRFDVELGWRRRSTLHARAARVDPVKALKDG